MIEAKDLKDVINVDVPEEPEKTEEPTNLGLPNRLGATPLELSILEGILLNKTPAQVATEVGLPAHSVKAYLSRKDVQEYLAELRDALNLQNQLILQDTLGKILQDRIAHLESEDYSELTKKDTLDVIKVFSEVTSAISKSKKDSEQADVFVQIYNQVME